MGRRAGDGRVFSLPFQPTPWCLLSRRDAAEVVRVSPCAQPVAFSLQPLSDRPGRLPSPSSSPSSRSSLHPARPGRLPSPSSSPSSRSSLHPARPGRVLSSPSSSPVGIHKQRVFSLFQPVQVVSPPFRSRPLLSFLLSGRHPQAARILLRLTSLQAEASRDSVLPSPSLVSLQASSPLACIKSSSLPDSNRKQARSTSLSRRRAAASVFSSPLNRSSSLSDCNRKQARSRSSLSRHHAAASVFSSPSSPVAIQPAPRGSASPLPPPLRSASPSSWTVDQVGRNCQPPQPE